MLVLTRHTGQEIVIGNGADAVTIRLLEIRGAKGRIGIDAPAHIPVHRREVYDELRRNDDRPFNPTGEASA